MPAGCKENLFSKYYERERGTHFNISVAVKHRRDNKHTKSS